MGEKSILGVGNRGRHSDTILAGSLYVLMMVHSWNEIRYKYRKIMRIILLHNIRLPENGCNIVGCYILRPFAHPVACCWMLFRVVAQSLKPVKLFSQQLPTFLLFRDRRSVAQQCWIRLHSSSNIVRATHSHYAWFTKTYRLYPSHDALQVPTLLVASVCTPLPTSNNFQNCWRNNVGSCCVRLHAALGTL